MRDATQSALFCSADKFYAMQLAVMLRTCGEKYRGPSPLTVYIVDGGLSDTQRSKVECSVPTDAFKLIWSTPAKLPAAQFFVSNHITISTYYRLLLADIVPRDVERIVYIDADTMILGDVSELLEMETEGNVLMARAQNAPPNWSLSPRERYFNAGVLVIDSEKWHARNVTHDSLEFARQHGGENTEWDQGALNAVLYGNWGELPGRWNAEPTPSVARAIVENDESTTIDLLHFLGVSKPWHSDYPNHSLQQYYFAAVDRTAWAGWRPRSGTEYWMRKAAGIPFISGTLSATREIRAKLGLNYASLYKFIRER